MHVAGIVNSVEHLETKNGKGWAKFQLEDFNDQFEFRIFGEEYLKFRHFIGINQFVRCKLVIKPGWVNKETGKVGEPRSNSYSSSNCRVLWPTMLKNLPCKFLLRQ